MERLNCEYSAKSIIAIASRKLIQIHAAIRRMRVEVFGECIYKSYHEEADVSEGKMSQRYLRSSSKPYFLSVS